MTCLPEVYLLVSCRDGMPVITIPFDYNEKLHSSVVPICICDTDLAAIQIHPAGLNSELLRSPINLRRMPASGSQ